MKVAVPIVDREDSHASTEPVEWHSFDAACLIVTTSGRILLLWDQDDNLPFQYPQLALLVASLFHFGQAQPFGHLELQNGFTVLMSADLSTQVIVVIICATLQVSRDNNMAWLELARLKTLIILHEFLQSHRSEIARLSVQSCEQAKRMADEYTLTRALDGVHDNWEGTLEIFIAFQNNVVRRLMEWTHSSIQTSIRSWKRDMEGIIHQRSPKLYLARGIVMNGATGKLVFSTCSTRAGSFFDQDCASQQLHLLYQSARVQQLSERIAKALHECAPLLAEDVYDQHNVAPAVVVRFRHSSSRRNVTELFLAYQMLPTGTFMTGINFHGDNAGFRGRQSSLEQLQQVLRAHASGAAMLRILQDPSQDVEVHIGMDGAPEEVWEAAKKLLAWAIPSSSVLARNPLDDMSDRTLKDNAVSRPPQLT